MMTVVLITGSIKSHVNIKMVLYTISGTVLAVMISMALQQAFIANKGSLNEALAIPYQQIACTYVENKDEMSDDEKESILQMIPDVDAYNPSIVDPVKWTATGDKDISKFVNLYLKLFYKYPKSYVNAFLMLDAGYLGLTDTSYAYIKPSLFETGIKDGFGINPTSYATLLKETYEILYTERAYLNNIVLNILCAPSFYFWIIVFVMLYALLKEQFELFPMIVFMTVFLATLLAGPCVLPRYALPYIICIPVMFACVVNTDGEK